LSGIVMAVHPALVRIAPTRARRERVGVVRMVSPVRIAQGEARDFSGVLDLPASPLAPARRLLSGPGGIWEAVATADGAPIGGDALAAWLGDIDCGEDVREALDARFDGTPLASHGDGSTYEPGNIARAYRGKPDPDGGAGRDPQGAGTRARADLAAFLESDVRVVDGRLLLRARPLATIDTWAVPSLSFGSPRSTHDFRVIAATPATLDDVVAAVPGLRIADVAAVERWKGLADLVEDDLDDVRWALNAWAGPVRQLLDHCLSIEWIAPADADAVREARDGLCEVEARALVGLAGRDSLQGPFDLLAAGIALGRAHGIGRAERQGLEGLRTRFETLLAPRLGASADILALSAARAP
jgi:hypothetical protein